jgi:hypothetical protein
MPLVGLAILTIGGLVLTVSRNEGSTLALTGPRLRRAEEADGRRCSARMKGGDFGLLEN